MVDTLEARLKRLEGVEEIHRLILEHSRLLDEGSVRPFVELFAEQDAEWIGSFGTYKGQAEIEAAVTQYANNPALRAASRHLVSSIMIDIEGDVGRAWSCWTLTTRGDAKPPALVSAGMYEDEFVREAAAWKFRRRIVTADSERA
ncbi:MAG: nuclear transport factor 2 family protein [Alphaproteobacteria bacterium]